MATLGKKIFGLAFLTLVISSFWVSNFLAGVQAATEVTVTIDSSKIVRTNVFFAGFQLDGPDLREWMTTSTLRQLASDAAFKMVRFFEYRLQPCTKWYESSKTGKWSWTQVDTLIQQILQIGAKPLIVLGFYNWYRDRLETPAGMAVNPTTGLPYPESWASYARAWVKHFKEKNLNVEYYELVNEPHHYFDWDNTEKVGDYIDLFEAAAKAMRAENPNVKISTDASIMKKVLNALISRKIKIDFLSYHGYGVGSLSASDSQIIASAETKYIGESTSIYGVDKAKQVYKQATGIDLPVIKSENNINFAYSSGTDPRIQQMVGVIYNALTVRTFMLKGYMCNIYFNFATSASTEDDSPSGGYGFGMVNLDNDKPWYPYYLYKLVGTNLYVGDKIIYTTSSSEDVRAVAWIHGSKKNLMIILKANVQKSIYIKGLSGSLTYFKISNAISWKTPAVQTGLIQASNPILMNGYTVMLVQTSS
ncbi:hypothetical protein KEJ47_01555 [Candidatus Bathyarchaeota archaeon]|nr:hypothetical protein [Candidatus Bathyarchaeota archaeon]